jgi:hypothetical protein
MLIKPKLINKPVIYLIVFFMFVRQGRGECYLFCFFLIINRLILYYN